MGTTYSDETVAVMRRAAALFLAASDDLDAEATTQINCLAAVAVLGLGAQLGDDWSSPTTGTDNCITEALRLLGSLPFKVFDTPAITAAARYGRRALAGRP